MMQQLWLLMAAILSVVGSAGLARDMRARDVDRLAETAPTVTEAYGADPLETGDLRMPPGKGPFPVALVIHGGCWTKGFATRRNTAPIASALTERGIATWNVEYRQVGDSGGGWPGTFHDWGAAADHLRLLARRYPLDLSRVVVVGHSAGAHAALWVAARPRLPRASTIRGRDPLRVAAVVAIDGPGDVAAFVGADQQICRQPVIGNFFGGTPDTQPARYRQGSPLALLPLNVPQYLVTSRVLTAEAAAAWGAAARRRGDRVERLGPLPGGDHFNIIAPGEPQWGQVEAFILRAFAHRRGG